MAATVGAGTDTAAAARRGVPPSAVTSAQAKVVRQRAPSLVRAAVARLEETPDFAALPAEVRAWVGVVVRTGIDGFARSVAGGARQAPVAQDAFAAVPGWVTRSVSLEQTVDMVRTTVDIVEEAVPELAVPGGEQELRGAVERYGREVAFGVARVYARAAEQRGAWDARLQALVVDALVAGAGERVVTARAASLGWPPGAAVRAAAVGAAGVDGETSVEHVVRCARRAAVPVVAAGHGEAAVVVLVEDPGGETGTSGVLASLLPEGAHAVLGHAVPVLSAAGPSVAAALAGLAALPSLPRQWRGTVVNATVLLPERVLAGDAVARDELVSGIYEPLRVAGTDLLATVDALLAAGGSLERAARALPVHVNTLRYRLSRVQQLTGVDPRSPRGAFALQLALALGRLPAL